MNDKIHRIHIKIGDVEFEAEGPTDIINQQFQAFQEMIKNVGTAQQSSTAGDTDPLGDKQDIDNNILSRIFYVSGDLLSLSATPETDEPKGDSLLLLIYGYNKIKNETKITGITLMKAAKQSGVFIKRVDALMNKKKEYVLTGGSKRGKRYSLNNKGIQYVEEMIAKML